MKEKDTLKCSQNTFDVLVVAKLSNERGLPAPGRSANHKRSKGIIIKELLLTKSFTGFGTEQRAVETDDGGGTIKLSTLLLKPSTLSLRFSRYRY